MTLAWILLAAALLATPPSTPSRTRGTREATRTGPVGPALASGVTALACVAVLGVPAGIAAGAPAALAVFAGLTLRPTAQPADRRIALVLDLCAAALRGGYPVADALAVTAPVAGPMTRDALVRVSRLLALGATPEQAWTGLPRGSPLSPVAPVAVRSAASGMRLADSFERLAVEIRAESGAGAQARAHRAGIWALAPLGACFLPAFVCLGIVPVVVGIVRSTSGVLP